MVEDTSTYKRKWIILLAVGMGAFLATIDGGIVNIGLNTLVKEFGRPLVVIEWVVLAYMLTVSSLMLSIGRLGDMLARKNSTLPVSLSSPSDLPCAGFPPPSTG
jgi:MFS family permease